MITSSVAAETSRSWGRETGPVGLSGTETRLPATFVIYFRHFHTTSLLWRRAPKVHLNEPFPRLPNIQRKEKINARANLVLPSRSPLKFGLKASSLVSEKGVFSSQGPGPTDTEGDFT